MTGMLTGLQQSLADYLASLESLSGQYAEFNCVTYSTGSREGCMSLVFRATDKLSNGEVAVKFVDPDLVAGARIDAMAMFDREYETMERLDGNSRSAQLAGAKGDIKLPIIVGGQSSELRVSYFPIEWLDGDVNRYFLNQRDVPCLEKLVFLRELFLAVESIHKLGFAHRDLKRDNIRAQTEGDQPHRIIVIDFGLAVHTDGARMEPIYPLPKGAPDFSPPEAFLGFEGERDLVLKSDTYALGAIMYAVFNSANFGVERIQNTEFAKIMKAHHVAFVSAADVGERLKLWNRLIYDFRLRLDPPDINGIHSSLPKHVSHLVERVYKSLAKFDFQVRPQSLARPIRDIESAIKVLRNRQSEKRDRYRRLLLRDRKLAKQHARLSRLKQREGSIDAGS